MAIIKKKSSKVMVMRKASPRAAGLIVFDISHSINSTSTVASATVEANVSADRRLIVGLVCPPLEENGLAYELVFKEPASPERKGNNFCRTKVDTKRKETTKGREEKIMAVGAGIPTGLQSSQLLPSGSMGESEGWGSLCGCLSRIRGLCHGRASWIMEWSMVGRMGLRQARLCCLVPRVPAPSRTLALARCWVRFYTQWS